MASVLLIHPSTSDLHCYVPYALLHLQSTLESHNHKVQLIDFQQGHKAFQTFRTSLKEKPDIVGISLFLGSGIDIAEKVIALTRQISPNTNIVCGGALPSMYPEQVLGDLDIDYIIRFEGEEAFVQLVESIENNSSKEIPNTGWKEGNEIILQTRGELLDLNEALPIDFNHIFHKRYILKGGYFLPCKRAASFFTSRGCPYSCNFCYNHYYNEGKWRPFPTEWVLDGIEKLVRKFNIDGLYIFDDNFLVNKNRGRDILEGVRARGMKLVYWWEMRIDQILRMGISELQQFYDLGLRCLYIGAETGSDRLLQILNKGFTVDDIRKANYILSQTGIQAKYSFMIGIPGETYDETLQTVDFIMEILDSNPTASIWQINNFILYPDTPMHEEKISNNTSETQPVVQSIRTDNALFLHSPNKSREVISYCSLFLKSDLFLRNRPFYYRYVFRLFRRIFSFRMRRHIFKPCIDTFLITMLFKVHGLPNKLRMRLLDIKW